MVVRAEGFMANNEIDGVGSNVSKALIYSVTKGPTRLRSQLRTCVCEHVCMHPI